jgi:hypothetical protein
MYIPLILMSNCLCEFLICWSISCNLFFDMLKDLPLGIYLLQFQIAAHCQERGEGADCHPNEHFNNDNERRIIPEEVDG